MHEFHVPYPATWVVVPETASIVTDPDLDDAFPRWPNPFEGSWRAIGEAVRRAVLAAQYCVSDPFQEEAEVKLAVDLSSPELFVVEEWLMCGPEVDAESGEITDGRHRMWNVKAAGISEMPVTLSGIGDAVKFYVDDGADQLMGYPTRQTLLMWSDSLQWWRSAEATAWRELNPDHERQFRRVVSAWSGRML